MRVPTDSLRFENSPKNFTESIILDQSKEQMYWDKSRRFQMGHFCCPQGCYLPSRVMPTMDAHPTFSLGVLIDVSLHRHDWLIKGSWLNSISGSLPLPNGQDPNQNHRGGLSGVGSSHPVLSVISTIRYGLRSSLGTARTYHTLGNAKG